MNDVTSIMQVLSESVSAMRKQLPHRRLRIILNATKRLAKKWETIAKDSNDPIHHHWAHDVKMDVAKHYGTLSDMAAKNNLPKIASIAKAKAHHYELSAKDHLNASQARMPESVRRDPNAMKSSKAMPVRA